MSINIPSLTSLDPVPLPKGLDLPRIAPLIEKHDPHLASEYYQKLQEYITDFEGSLANDECLAIKLVSFGEAITVIVETL